MKRFFAFLGIAILVVVVAVCHQQQKKSVPLHPVFEEYPLTEGLALEVVEGNITPTGVMLRFTNETEETYYYSRNFSLQKLGKDRWYFMSYLKHPVTAPFPAASTGSASGTSEAQDEQLLLPGGMMEVFYDWSFDYGEMEPGQYRVLSRLYADGLDWDEIKLTAEFIIQ